jgi:hypothetical protein
VSGKTFDKCVGDSIDLFIRTTGVQPIQVLYLKKVGNDDQILQVPSSKQFEQDNLKYTNESSSNSIDMQRNRYLDYLVEKTVDIPISADIQVDSDYIFNPARITDALGNSIEYIGTTQTQLPPLDSKSSNWKVNSSDYFVKVHGHSPPTVDFESCQNIKIKTDYDPTYEQAPSVKIPIRFKGTPPFNLSSEFIAERDMPAQPLQMNNIKSMGTELLAIQPGTFRLGMVTDKFCKKPKVDKYDTKICTIIGVDPPTFDYLSFPIKETCFGNVGTKIELTLTGQPPFEIEFLIEKTILGKQGRVNSITETQKINKQRGNIILKPKEPGDYNYIFKRVICKLK